MDFFKNAPFLIKNYNITISYAPSWKIFNRAQSLPSIFNYKTLCFSYGENASDLICSQQEIDSMTTALGKENVINFTKNDCVKEWFLTEWQHKNYSILHLSLHAKGSLTNQFDNKLWFKPNKQDYLYGFELSGRRSSVQLVVLSACETGLGSVTSGEGAYSMARSFFQSGAKTVLATLWEVEDCQNAIIIQYFYTFLKKGLKPKQALCEAKRLFLKNAIKDELMSHPKFWAGVICLE